MSNLRIDNSVRLIGKLRLGNNVYIAQGSVLRSIDDSITIGNSSWVLENSVLIGTPEHSLKVGSKTIFGHKCIAIGAEIGDLCEIGNGVIFLPSSKIGNMCIFGEGTIIPEGRVIPDGSVVVGRPGRIIRKLTTEDKNMISRMRGNDISLSSYVENIIDNEAKEGEKMGNLYEYGVKYPVVAESAFIYDSAEITGDVTVGNNSVIGSGVRIVGNSHGPVKIGNNVQILENSVLHLLPDNELVIDDNVIIGPGCIIHGTNIGSNTIIESGSIVCDYSKLGKNTLVKSGSLVKQRSVFEDNQIVEGFPAKIVGENTEIQKKPAWAL
ncbi:carbonic anhydrase/acetyltransferase [Clostridium sp. MSJ-11]|uniref:Carbonic anhydrase/acetyltransferase n=1 Tax=Clostridium mobile TaxID=2841512 RepID=A0ABS6EE02_9CLOT|nr:carbonic anhydrase/acetyltransferase [Clostridium mobile]MBU5483268.1 carbonic anhydrase/acetyltransferase [Clostridium mobile]